MVVGCLDAIPQIKSFQQNSLVGSFPKIANFIDVEVELWLLVILAFHLRHSNLTVVLLLADSHPIVVQALILNDFRLFPSTTKKEKILVSFFTIRINFFCSVSVTSFPSPLFSTEVMMRLLKLCICEVFLYTNFCLLKFLELLSWNWRGQQKSAFSVYTTGCGF